MRAKGNVVLGLDCLLSERIEDMKGVAVGIMTNHTAVTKDLVHITDALHSAGVNIKALFGPEHGVRGDAAEGASVGDSLDPKLGVPVYSLYGTITTPTDKMLESLDLMLIDIQDVGARFYTFVYTMAEVMEACGRNDVKVWVLDRPNPISGTNPEGPILQPEFTSGVGMYAIPVRHGLTTGELARLYKSNFGVECDLDVVKMKNWSREMWYDETGLPWVIPSLNMPTLDTAAVYPGTCFFEGTNVSEGRGITRPFEIFGAPWIDSCELKQRMLSYNLPGVAYREANYSPFEWKYRGEPCSGLQIYVTDRREYRPVLTGIAAVAAIRHLYPDMFAFRSPAQNGKHFFDLLAGSNAIREAIDAGHSPYDIAESWRNECSEFERKTKEIMLY